MISYEEYHKLSGNVSKEEFDDLEPRVVVLIEAIIQSKIPFWNVRPIEEYNLDLKKIITLQIDYIAENGGVQAFLGKSDFNFKSANSSGMKFEMNTNGLETFKGVPLSSIAMTLLDTELYIAGLKGVLVA